MDVQILWARIINFWNPEMKFMRDRKVVWKHLVFIRTPVMSIMNRAGCRIFPVFFLIFRQYQPMPVQLNRVELFLAYNYAILDVCSRNLRIAYEIFWSPRHSYRISVFNHHICIRFVSVWHEWINERFAIYAILVAHLLNYCLMIFKSNLWWIVIHLEPFTK